MFRRLSAALMLVVLASACANSRVVRLDTGQGAPLTYTPLTTSLSVGVSEEDFERALNQLVLAEPLAIRPPEQGWLVRTSSPRTFEKGTTGYWVGKAMGGPCRRGQARAGCVSLLDDVMGLGEYEKLAVGLGLSFQPMRQSIARALEETMTPQFFAAAIGAGMVTWIILAANPEPVFTKAMAVVAAVMAIYLGVDAFLAVVRASQELKRATDRATTWEELEEASVRFGEAVGPKVVRVFILAVTVVLSRGTMGGASWLAARLPLLPRFAEASAAGRGGVGIVLEQVGQVSAVAVVGEQLAISLGPTAVAVFATSSGGEGQWSPPAGGPGEWVKVDEHMSDGARAFQSQKTGAPSGYAYRVKKGDEEVDFDGFEPTEQVLLEVKGPNLAKFFGETLEPQGFFKGARKFIEQAQRQVLVAQGTRVRWVVAEKKFADALRKLFRENDLEEIEVLHSQP
jgi:hypothetical protein